ncbi:MAG TPA: class I SAM-dependent methyltransferase [Pyrinomonadaceae bacterium]|nr:class I SAM-dependent methyltransferase [Pyrinomonadaceae bacterium]
MTQDQPTGTLRAWTDTAKHWTKHSDTIREMFSPLTDALIADAGIVQGMSVLDVAGGAGEPSLTIARKVGPDGSVMCTDAIAEMVEAAQAAALQQGVTNVEFRQCAAESLPFSDNSFDATVSRLGAMFFSDPQAASSEMLRVTKPRGTIALVVWGKSELNPFSYVVTNILDRHVEPMPVDPDAPGAFRFAEAGKLATILRDAGAVEVRDRVHKFDIAAPISPADFWQLRSRVSDSLRTKLEKLSVAEQAQIAQEVLESVKEFFPDNQMRFPAQMLIATGRKSG